MTSVVPTALAALTLAATALTTAAPAEAATTCAPKLHSESRTALSGEYLTLTGTALWRICTIPSGAHYDDPAKAQLAYTWVGNPHCGRIFGGLIRITWTFTVLDDAPRKLRVTGAIPCHKNGIGVAEVSLAGSPRLAESLGSRWLTTFVVHYRNMPDPSVTVRGGFS